MTQITSDHVEWVVVSRLRSMLEEPPHASYNVTQAYSLLTAILCWVMQRVRIPTHQIDSLNDRTAHRLLKVISEEAIADDPWRVHGAPTRRIETVGSYRIAVPAPMGFENHKVDRFLINLRDATAHGDARNISPFNVAVGCEQLLVGFSFLCTERRDESWKGKITLLEGDMRRIGGALAKRYCDALRRSELHRRDNHFGSDAASVKEVAA